MRGHLFLKSFLILYWDWEQMFPVLFFLFIKALTTIHFSFQSLSDSDLHISWIFFHQSYFPVFWTINPSRLHTNKNCTSCWSSPLVWNWYQVICISSKVSYLYVFLQAISFPSTHSSLTWTPLLSPPTLSNLKLKDKWTRGFEEGRHLEGNIYGGLWPWWPLVIISTFWLLKCCFPILQ